VATTRGTVILALLAVAGGTGCSNFLASDDVANNPNLPSTATAQQLFIGVQSNVWFQYEGGLAHLACIMIQACTGVRRDDLAWSRYDFNRSTFTDAYTGLYIGGGLVDIKQIKSLTHGIFHGVARIYEALDLLLLTEVFGDVPYRDAAGTNPTPILQAQDSIYGDLLTLLDGAITDLATGTESPGASDLVFSGNAGRWTAVAHTLKARIWLRRAEGRGNPAYQTALVEANLGITDPSGAGNLVIPHSGNAGEGNPWFGQVDLAVGNGMETLMNARQDPRAPEYFACDPRNGIPCVAGSTPLTGSRHAVDFDQPLVTYEENELIRAETTWHISSAGAAAQFLNNVRGAHGLPDILAPLLQDIAEEKYIVQFQNIEAWADWKRTCDPVLTPTDPAVYDGEIPGRAYYGEDEVKANPNYPPASWEKDHGGNWISDPSFSGFRNWDDEKPCP
jgi:hypothetical protein